MRKEKELAAEAAGKKRHVKSGYGGLLDIQIATSFLLLKNSLPVPNTLEALAEVEKNELLSTGDCRALHKAWIFPLLGRECSPPDSGQGVGKPETQ